MPSSFIQGLSLGALLGFSLSVLYFSRLIILGQDSETKKWRTPESQLTQAAVQSLYPHQETNGNTNRNNEPCPLTNGNHAASNNAPISRPGWSPVHLYTGTEQVGDVQRKPSKRDAPGLLHSQISQDRDVATLYNCKKNGYFIDLAANDPVWISNTRFLERDLNWKGICIDVNPKYWYPLVHRDCLVIGAPVGRVNDKEVEIAFREDAPWLGGVVGKGLDNDREVEYDHMVQGDAGADLANADAVKQKKRPRKIGETVKRRTVSLEEVLEYANAPPVVDYLSLDVEGFEGEVLGGYDFNKRPIGIITIERPKEDLVQQLRENKYVNATPAHYRFGETLWVHGEFGNSGESGGKIEVSEEWVGKRLRGGCVEDLVGKLLGGVRR